MKFRGKSCLTIIISLLMTVSMVGCGGSNTSSVASKNNNGSSVESSIDIESVVSGEESTASTMPENASGVASNVTSDKGGTGNTNTSSKVNNDKILDKIPGASTIINSKNYNMKGATVKIGKWYGFHEATGTDETAKRQKAINEKIEKTFNCKLEFVEVKSGSDPSLKASILSGKPKVDFFGVQGIDTFYDLYSAGCLMPLDSVSGMNIKDTSRFILHDEAKFNGKYYGVGQKVYGWLNLNFNNILMCNFDLTAQAGYPASTIYGWMNSGQWTWNKFEEVCKAVSKISGKYGISDLDQNKMYGFDLSYELYSSMLYSNNTDWVVKKNDGFVFNGGSKEALEVLNRYASWANPNTGFVKFTKTAYDDFQNGKTAFLANIYPLPIIATWASGSYKTGAMYFPKGPNATNYVSKAYESLFVVIPKGVSNFNAIGAIANAFCTPLYSDAESRTLCKNDVMKTAKLTESVNVMMKIFDDKSAYSYPTSLYGTAAGLGIGESSSKLGWFDYVRKVAQGEMTAQSAIDAFSSRANNVLASTYN